MKAEAERAPRVLVVEDEADVAALIAYQLTRDGFRVETAETGTRGIEAALREIPDLIVLDRMLPELSGDEVLRSLRSMEATRLVPVLLLTAKREQEDRIEGLELGADDYLTKPFSPRELVLRVEAIIRRSREGSASAGDRIVEVGPVRMDLGSRRVTVEGEAVDLTATEFRLLEALLERPGRAFSRAQLLSAAWDLDSGVAKEIQTRTVDMHVRRLRRKLAGAEHLLETVRGFGYRFQPPKTC